MGTDAARTELFDPFQIVIVRLEVNEVFLTLIEAEQRVRMHPADE